VLLVAMASASSLTFQVEPKEMECFQQTLDPGSTFNMNFEVSRGGLLDIKMRITDGSNTVVLERLAFFNKPDPAANEAEGRVSFVATSGGLYQICFDNRMSRWTAKIVSVNIPDPQQGSHHDEIAKLEHLGPMVDSVIKISDDLENILRLQAYYRTREQSHRDTQTSINSRVQWLAITEAFLLVVVTAVQLQVVRGWFSDAVRRRPVV